MKSFVVWCAVVVGMTLGAGAAAAVAGVVVRRVGLEYLVVVCNLPYEAVLLDWWTVVLFFMSKGMRMGLVLGTLLAACALVGKRRPAQERDLILGSAGAILSILFFSFLAGLGAYLLARWGWVTLPASIGRQVGHPYRVWLSYGLEYGAAAGGIAGAIVAGLAIFSNRTRTAS